MPEEVPPSSRSTHISKTRSDYADFSRRGLTAATSELNLAAAVTDLLKLHRYNTPLAT